MSAALSAVAVERLAARNLKRIRQRAGMSAERLSLALDMTSLAVRDIEQGAARLRVDILVRAAAVLGAPVERFFDDEPDAAEVAA